MFAINISRFSQGVQAMTSMVKKQPKNTLSFISKILTARNSETNLNKSQYFSKDIKVHTEQTGKREAPQRPPQPSVASKLKMALADHRQDPVTARAKWGLSKGIPDKHTVK